MLTEDVEIQVPIFDRPTRDSGVESTRQVTLLDYEQFVEDEDVFEAELEEPWIAAMVFKAHAREAERKELLRCSELEGSEVLMEFKQEAVGAEVVPRVSAMQEAQKAERVAFNSVMCAPRAHFFVPQLLDPYKPTWKLFDENSVLRDWTFHLREGCLEVPMEWADKACRRMLAMENLLQRTAAGHPLPLRWPNEPPSTQMALLSSLAGSFVARGRARGRKTLRWRLRGALRERSPRRGVRRLQGLRLRRQGVMTRMMARAWMLLALWSSCQIHHAWGLFMERMKMTMVTMTTTSL
ncbi:hypothetical protein RHSIM_Rhsim01G0157100 [Rhododendron simsii]|uniref:Uncharacterized protein n=1 Tax=Rhododendron simsii TaxID=118357 RepID=A0A834HQL9_RHOSS|nr:hypothetical protein RHSIM_Rhsim01G0157100 [Rhododendron simsii]